MQNNKLDRLGIDLEHYKTSRKHGEKKVSLNVSLGHHVRSSVVSKQDANMTIDLEESFMFKESPVK